MQEILHKAKHDSKDAATDNDDDDNKQSQIDSGSALQQFLDRIPLRSISGIQSSFALELKAGDSVKDAIRMLYENDLFGAPIADVLDPDAPRMEFSYRYIGFLDFSTMVLWCIQEYENFTQKFKKNRLEGTCFFSTLDQIPKIGHTKVGELAKPFVWEPFFPVHLDDTLLHALLLLSKHPLRVLPVTQHSDPQVIGLVTQNALVQLLLESSGLEWFDNIADKALSDLKLEAQEHASYVFEDQTVADALHVLWENRTCTVAVVDRQTKKLIGCVRNSDIYHLVENDDLFRNRKNLTVGEFIHSKPEETKASTEIDNGASMVARSIHLKKRCVPRMDSPLTNKKSDTLKQLMQQTTERNSRFTFVINEKEQVTGLITLRDVILQFAPPCVSSSIDGGGFFQIALEQSGCHIEDGTLVHDH
ncbi:SNF1-related protein kinase regulatory subunit gamma-1-like [Prosopis cineraria]|uniref:SNF1-related protein kinase regulatory subunit gamma-1-like n=1 Tax=Prosopis cineraria TaxID=364024 RepID=UPI00240ED012|nr:SNF1-related protein kinase regulatory subunit gamma-1-like [Prosopis cineraria]